MLPPIRKLFPWSNSFPVLAACSDVPNVVAWLAVRSIVPHGVVLHVLPLPGGQGIGLLFVSRMANWLRKAVVTGFGRGNASSCRHRGLMNCGLELLLHRSKSAPFPSRWSCAKPRM